MLLRGGLIPSGSGSHSHFNSLRYAFLAGNIIYRRVVEHNKPFYQSVQKRHRILVSQSIVHTILNRGGRFLSEDTQTTTNEDGTRSSVTVWKPVATARAIQKTSQALRERVAGESSKSKVTETSGLGQAV